MEFEMIFLTAVLGFAGIHLLFNLANFLAKFIQTSVNKTSKNEVLSDWYVFFEKSALYGDEANIAKVPEVVSNDATTTDSVFNDPFQPQESYV